MAYKSEVVRCAAEIRKILKEKLSSYSSNTTGDYKTRR